MVLLLFVLRQVGLSAPLARSVEHLHPSALGVSVILPMGVAVVMVIVYFLTATYGVQDFPEFVGAATVDEVQVGYCDSNIKTAKPKQDWMRKLIERNPEHLEWYSQKCLGSQHVFRANIDDLKRRLNLTEGPHILQRMNGCEWDDETGEITGFNQYGYNGEDFLALDLKTLTWIAPKSQAVLTKLIWDAKKARLEHNKNYYIYKCPDWLKNYIRHGKSFLQRTESPSISLLQKTPSSVVSCHATGFFPDRAEMFWRKDGEEIHEDVEKGEILLNNDGTFQMSVELNVSSVPPDSWKQYDCVFQLSGVGDDIKITLDKSVIRTNWGKTHLSAPVAGIVGGFLLILLLGIAVVVLRMKKSTGEEKQYSGNLVIILKLLYLIV
uniref:Ig-like domain-containing protein n=1 Tax=Xiphophorus couchianus TaxID=32473 RepID=A0A3B5MHD5_9TELE